MAVASKSSGKMDFQTAVKQAMKEAEKAEIEANLPKYDDPNTTALESFYHNNGAVYSCLYQGGERFYMDSWQTMVGLIYQEIVSKFENWSKIKI